MIYLVSQVFIYLLIAILVGGVAGWLLAQLRIRKAMGGLDMQLSQLQRDVARRDDSLTIAERRIAELSSRTEEPAPMPAPAKVVVQLREQIAQKEAQIVDLQAELTLVAEEHRATRTSEEASGNLITVLHAEIARLRLDLQQKLSVNPKQTEALELANRELEARLVRKLSEVDRLEQALAAEEHRVRELERERDLQNKSLHVLHQQLEMERAPANRATATG